MSTPAVLSRDQILRALEIAEKIAALEAELDGLVAKSPGPQNGAGAAKGRKARGKK